LHFPVTLQYKETCSINRGEGTMFKQIFRGLLSASVAVCLLAFMAGCSNTQGGYGGGRDTTGTGGTYGTTTTGTETGNIGNDQGMQTGRGSVTDGTALAKLMSADSSEIAVSTYALDRISDSRVKDYAQMLIDDHQKDQSKVKSLASQLNITPMPSSTDSTSMHMDHAMSMLGSADKGQSFDQAFLQMQVNDHRETIDALKALQSLSTNDQIKNHINDVLPKLQKHMDQAQELIKNLGMSQTGH
jgi:putative membrane protein